MMSGRMYRSTFQGSPVQADSDVFQFFSGPNTVFAIHDIHLTQELSEVSVSNAVMVRRLNGSITSTPSDNVLLATRRMLPGSPAANAAIYFSGTGRVVTSAGWDMVRVVGGTTVTGWHWVFPPEQRIIMRQSTVLAVSFWNTPPEAWLVSGELTFEEIG
jgi:hypothetical protein